MLLSVFFLLLRQYIRLLFRIWRSHFTECISISTTVWTNEALLNDATVPLLEQVVHVDVGAEQVADRVVPLLLLVLAQDVLR